MALIKNLEPCAQAQARTLLSSSEGRCMAIWASWRQKRPWWGRICSRPQLQNSVLTSFMRTVRSSPGLAAHTATCAGIGPMLALHAVQL